MKFLTRLILPALILAGIHTHAQILKGVVIDAVTSEPVLDANVYLNNKKTGTHTNRRGRFGFKVRKSRFTNDTLYISHINYLTLKIPNPLKNLKDTIRLQVNMNLLSEVEIINNRKKKKFVSVKMLPSLPQAVHSFGSLIYDDKIWVLGGDITYEVNAYQKVIEDYPVVVNEMQDNSSIFFNMNMLARQYFSFYSYSDKIMVFDLNTNTWTTLNDTFLKRAYHNANLIGQKAYILGGKRLSNNRLFEYLENKIEVYDLHKSILQTDPVNPHQAINFTSVSYGNNIIVLGGSIKKDKKDKRTYTDKVHLFDIQKGLWYEIAHMPEAKEISGVLVNDVIYIIGGIKDNRSQRQLESYDLKTGKWKLEGELFEPVGLPAVCSNGNSIYFYENGKLNIYDTQSRVLKQYLVSQYTYLSKMHYSNGKLFIFGGMRETKNEITPSALMYSINLDDLPDTRIYKIKKL